MIVRLLTSTAAAAVILTGLSVASFAQNSTGSMSDQSTTTQMNSGQMNSGSQSAQPMKHSKKSSMKSSSTTGSSASSSSTKSSSSTSTNKQVAQGHKLDNIADKLNACGGRPAAERQSCMDQATHM